MRSRRRVRTRGTAAVVSLAALAALASAGAGQAAAGPWDDPSRWSGGHTFTKPAVPASDLRAAADVEAVLTDAAGDLQVDPALPFPPADILRLSARFVDGGIGRVDDDMIEVRALVDNNPGTGFSEALVVFPCPSGSQFLCQDVLTYDIDSIPGAGNAEGADRRIIVFGTNDGIPVQAGFLTWNAATGSFAFVRAITLDKSGTEWVWRLSAADLGAERGRPVGIELFARNDRCSQQLTNCTVTGGDFAPDVDPYMLLQLPGNPAAPTVGIPSAGSVGTDAAVISAPVNPLGAATTVHVRYGVGSVAENRTPDVGVGEGTTDVTSQTTLGGLRFSTTYQYQVVARSPWGETAGPVQTFRTLPAATSAFGVSTEDARAVTLSSARLTGVVNPLGAGAVYYWQYGTRTLNRRTARVSLAPGSPPGTRQALVRNLVPGTEYRYRLVVEVDGRTITGNVRRFRTRQRDRLLISARVPLDCFLRSRYCTVPSLFTVVVRLRDGGSGRTVTAPTRSMRLAVRCVTGCGVRGTVPLRGRSLLSANAAGLFRGVRLRAGALIEVRATRPGAVGAVFRVRLNNRLEKTQQSCELTPAGRPTRCTAA